MDHAHAIYFRCFVPSLIPSLALSVSLLLISTTILSGCGGGGGSSQNPGVVTPISTQSTPVSTQPASGAGFLNPSDPSNVSAARASGITGAGVTVGIIDTDFDVTDPQLAGRITKNVYTAATGTSSGGFIGASGNGDTHGTLVAEALGGTNTGIAPAVQMAGIAAGIGGGGTALSADIYTFLYNNGVRIFNQSNGVGSIATPVDGVTYHSIYQPFVAKGGLFVWATGNGGAAQPTMTAGLPALYPDLQAGWLAVTAVNAVGGTQAYSTADMVPGSIASYANRCGLAANWCLAAPGDFVSPTAGERVYGTSFAAPAVTGAIALVQQVYPWMNADLLRQTILSTATPMNDTATYGWGLLNASKAVNGPALFMQSLALGPNVNVSFNTVSAIFSNAIAGDAGLTKSGTGTLTLSGANTYTGNNEVVNGTLNITGSIASGVQIDTGGNLSGNGGHLGSSVTNNGRLSNAGSGLTIAGNYTASANAILANDFNATLTVGGTAILGGSHLVATVPAGNADANAYVTAQANNTPQKVLTAFTAVNNTFSDVSFQSVGTAFPPLLSASVSYSAKEVDLKIGRVSTTTVAAQSFSADPTRANSAANVEQAMTAADTMMASGQTGGSNAPLIASAAALERVADVAALGTALDSLSGQIHASAQALSFQQSQTVNRTLANRLSQLGVQNQQVKTGLWVSAIGASGKLAEAGYARADTSMLGGQFGFDTQVNERAIVGAAIAYSDSQASFDRFGGNSKSQNTGVSLYGRYALTSQGNNDADGGPYITSRVGAGTVSSTVKRTAIAGAEIENLQASHTDTMLSAYVEYGYALKLSDDAARNIMFTPFIGAAYDRLERGSFAETGGSFGLIANRQSYGQTAGLVGVRGQGNVDWFAGKSTIQAYAQWQHGFANGNLDFAAAFLGAPASHFIVQGIALSGHSGWAGVGISTAINRRWSWYANYDGQFSRGGLVNNVLSVGVRIGFD
ncbi:autotransporter domain-containing protein [Glaciimonas sp. GG7]